MSLPPIVTNSPLFKVLTGTQNKTVAEKDDVPGSSAPQDTVTLSAEALNRLDQNAAIASDADARKVAGDLGALLQRDEGLNLSGGVVDQV